MRRLLSLAMLALACTANAEESFDEQLERAGYRFASAQVSLPELLDSIAEDFGLGTTRGLYEPAAQGLAFLEELSQDLYGSELDELDPAAPRDAIVEQLRSIVDGVTAWKQYVLENGEEPQEHDYARKERIMRNMILLEKFELTSIKGSSIEMRSGLMQTPYLELAERIGCPTRHPTTHIIIEHACTQLPGYIARHRAANPEQAIQVHILQEAGEPTDFERPDDKHIRVYVYPVSFLNNPTVLKNSEALREVEAELRDGLSECLSFGNRLVLQSPTVPNSLLPLSTMRPLYAEFAKDQSRYATYQLQLITSFDDADYCLNSGEVDVYNGARYASLDAVVLYEPWFYERWFN